MPVLLSTIGSRGDVQPVVALHGVDHVVVSRGNGLLQAYEMLYWGAAAALLDAG
jgi:hypothetical protein